MNERTVEDQLWADFKASPPVLDKSQFREMEIAYQEQEAAGFGAVRRSSFALLSLSGQELVEKIDSSAEAALTLAQLKCHIDRYAQQLRVLTDIIDTASMRISLGLCVRPDMESVLAKAKAEFEHGASE